MIRRTCWNESMGQQQKKSVPSCYYPVTSRICIHSMNSSVEMCVLPDRAQGGTSYNEGELELMLHRRLLTDDGFGLEESLNEEANGVGLVVRGRHRVYIGNFRQEVDELTFSERIAQATRRWQWEPWLFFTSGDKINRRKWQNVRNKRFSTLRIHGLPRHVRVLTLEPWKAGSVLLRLENTLEKPVRGSKEKLDNPEDVLAKTSHITVELKKIFLSMRIKMVKETTLAANQWLEDARQMDWSTRYVYNGGDDGILPEDADYDKEDLGKQVEQKDNVSEEEQDYPKRKNRRQRQGDKGQPKFKTETKYKPSNREFERRKRSVNATANINENVINKTFDDVQKAERQVYNATDDEGYNISIKVSSVFEDNPTTETYVTLSAKQQKPNFLRTHKPGFWTGLAREDEEIPSEEEDFSYNLRKRLPRRKNKNNQKPRPADFPVEDSDDGVTKSIYEMYYKHPKTFNKSKNHQEFDTKRNRRRRLRKNRQNSDEETPLVSSVEWTTKRIRNRNRKKMKKADMPFFLEDRKKNKYDSIELKPRDRMEWEDDGIPPGDMARSQTPNIREKRRKPISQEYDNPDSNEDERDRDSDERKVDTRRKRNVPTYDDSKETVSAEEIPDTEFVITLRPTQIRTFIVWFMDPKRVKN